MKLSRCNQQTLLPAIIKLAVLLIIHKHMEMVVDNHVDNNCKCVIITILHHIAQGLHNLNN